MGEVKGFAGDFLNGRGFFCMGAYGGSGDESIDNSLIDLI